MHDAGKVLCSGREKRNRGPRYRETKFLGQLGLFISTNIGQRSSNSYLGNVNLLQPEIIENIRESPPHTHSPNKYISNYA